MSLKDLDDFIPTHFPPRQNPTGSLGVRPLDAWESQELALRVLVQSAMGLSLALMAYPEARQEFHRNLEELFQSELEEIRAEEESRHRDAR